HMAADACFSLFYSCFVVSNGWHSLRGGGGCLSWFGAYDFIFVANTFSLIGFGRANGANVGRHLADQYFISSLYVNGVVAFYFQHNSFHGLDIHRVRKADRHRDAGTFGRSAVPCAHELERFLEAFRNTANVISNQA